MNADLSLNTVELAIADAKAGRLAMGEMLRALLDAELAIPSGGEVQPDGSGFLPVVFDRNGTQMVACFTARKRVDLGKMAPWCLTMKGREFLRRVPDGYGVVVNPGGTLGFEIDPDGLRRMLADLA